MTVGLRIKKIMGPTHKKAKMSQRQQEEKIFQQELDRCNGTVIKWIAADVAPSAIFTIRNGLDIACNIMKLSAAKKPKTLRIEEMMGELRAEYDLKRLDEEIREAEYKIEQMRKVQDEYLEAIKRGREFFQTHMLSFIEKKLQEQ